MFYKTFSQHNLPVSPKFNHHTSFDGQTLSGATVAVTLGVRASASLRLLICGSCSLQFALRNAWQHSSRGHSKTLQLSRSLYSYRSAIPQSPAYLLLFLISSFRRVLNIVRFLLGNSPAPEVYMPTFRNTLFHLHGRVSVCRIYTHLLAYEDETVFRNVGI
jgi:hypothetical protein